MNDSFSGEKFKRDLRAKYIEKTMPLETFSSLEPKDRMFLILIWRKLKSASPVSLQGGIEKSKELEKILKAADLLFKKGPVTTEEKNGLKAGQVYFVANNEADLNLISERWFGDHKRDPDVYEEIGRMSGFPKTARDAYDAFSNPKYSAEQRSNALKKVYSEQDKIKLLKERNQLELFPFARLFYMSKKNWDTELETVRKWASELKTLASSAYTEFIVDFNKTNNYGIEIKLQYGQLMNPGGV